MIVCIGWGSLIWCQKTLPVVGDWQVDGPALPVEFARESRDGRMTLVISDDSPAVDVLWAHLDVPSLQGAKQALAAREGIREHNIRHSIGYWSPTETSGNKGADQIGPWAKQRGFEGAVWTALKPRIGDDNRLPNEQEVIAHLNALDDTARNAAEEYVRLAPRQIKTPYRATIEAVFGWTPSGLI